MFFIERNERKKSYLPGPRPMTYNYWGVGVPAT